MFDPDHAEKRQAKIDRACDQYTSGVIGAVTCRVLLNIAGCGEFEIKELMEQCERAKEAVTG
jgi:hypothetical protein